MNNKTMRDWERHTAKEDMRHDEDEKEANSGEWKGKMLPSPDLLVTSHSSKQLMWDKNA